MANALPRNWGTTSGRYVPTQPRRLKRMYWGTSVTEAGTRIVATRRPKSGCRPRAGSVAKAKPTTAPERTVPTTLRTARSSELAARRGASTRRRAVWIASSEGGLGRMVGGAV
jgi:hypothetical protein